MPTCMQNSPKRNWRGEGVLPIYHMPTDNTNPLCKPLLLEERSWGRVNAGFEGEEVRSVSLS